MSKNKSLTWLAVLVLLCGLFSTLFLDEVGVAVFQKLLLLVPL